MPIATSFVALDLELNQPSGAIIQVGICLGSADMPDREYQTHSWLLDPSEPIAPSIVALTGIDDEAIARGAVPVAQVAQELTSILDSWEGVFINPVTWGGGDMPELKALFARAQVPFPKFGRRWLDVKTWHTLAALAVDKNPAGGLSSVMARYGLQFKGLAHRADVDAFNTLRLFFRMLERQRALEKMAELGKRVVP
jgi:DNA polymerase III epsilon subunit-like protein